MPLSGSIAIAVTATVLQSLNAPGATQTLPEAPPSISALASGGVMQIVAHEDDDLLFMNPDVDRSLTAGLPSATVYVTAGEITGDGPTPAARARNRQRGVQNAYATMAGVADGDDSTQNEWVGDVVTVDQHAVERYRLRARSDVGLLFMGLPDASLQAIDQGGARDTVIPANGLVNTSSRYTRADVVAVLRELVEVHQPTLLRTHDAEPDVHTTGNPADHPDHVAAARFSREATDGHPDPLFELSYRGYNTANAPINLTPDDVARKDSILQEYYRYDNGSMGSGDSWIPRRYYRWSNGTGWSATDSQGRAQLFVVRSGSVQWYSQVLRELWDGPTPLPDAGGRLAPGLAVGRHTDGRLEVVARRLSDHHLVAVRQVSPGGQFQTAWTDLGSPALASGNADQTGTPSVAVRADGRLVVFVPNASGGVSTLTQSTGGGWNPTTWVALAGTDVQDGLSAVTTRQGRIELFARSRTSLLHWSQPQPNGPFVLDTALPGGQPASAPNAVLDANGRVNVIFMEPGTGQLQLTYQTQPGGSTWSSRSVELADIGDTMAPAMVLPPAAGVTLLGVTRNLGVSVGVQERQGLSFTGWTSLGGSAFGQPTAVLDGTGQVAVCVIGSSGVSVGRLQVTSNSFFFGAWQRLSE